MRDETDPDLQARLQELRNAAQLAMRRIGDPLAAVKFGGVAGPLTPRQAETEAADLPMHPRLLADVTLLSEADLIAVMKEVITSSEEISWAKLEKREPVIPALFRNYEQRRLTAETVGKELARRGGTALLERVLERDLNSYQSIRNWWSDLEVAPL
ncbi:MAG: hypothetical protein L0Y58_23515 [Verrucomicrobia subdivision 3 bacterium]|nr:hypothetical protein [Limisphaerales bacterium]